ncbi:Thiol:disulfide interchange protein DsbD precursor [compost metagenome]
MALFLGALEFTPKAPRERLAQLAGLVLLVYAVAAWTGSLQGESDPLRPLGRAHLAGAPSVAPAAGQWQTIKTSAELSNVFAEAKGSGQPLLLDWYADWCISCKVIEREVLTAPEVTAQLGGYRLIRFDMTESNEEQRALLDRFKLFGPPAILFFDGKAFAARLQQANASR